MCHRSCRAPVLLVSRSTLLGLSVPYGSLSMCTQPVGMIANGLAGHMLSHGRHELTQSGETSSRFSVVIDVMESRTSPMTFDICSSFGSQPLASREMVGMGKMLQHLQHQLKGKLVSRFPLWKLGTDT
ncbi:hypothetical protein BGW80DRAFT_1316241 [Lactifluus volemus]|nr:hypothetical protein BGW80DRAFT_1316241 [Lactifluus volemus]